MPDTSSLLWPFFDDVHRDIAAKLDAWAASRVGPIVDAHDDTDAACRILTQQMGKAGWLGHVARAADGGAAAEIDVRALCVIRETLARHSGLADFVFAMQGLGSVPISLFGSEALRRRYVTKVVKGAAIAAFALSERDGDGFVINGAKTWISNAGLADFYVVFARTGEAPGARGLGAFVVDGDAGGLEVSERIDVTSPHPLGSLRFNGCRVAASQRLGDEGDGFKIAMSTLDIFRSTVGAAALGFARRALDEAVKRAGERIVFNHPLADFQMTQQKIADMATEIDASALLVYRAAWEKDTGEGRITRQAAMAKMYATEAAQRVIDQAVQLFGGAGVVSGSIVEALYRDIRPLRIYEGTTEIQKIVIAREVFKEGEQ
jgi:alkylation response protein AidB-like acyl-CoA dehydrogenase